MPLHLTADLQANYDQFISRVRKDKVIWGLESEDGWAICPSNDQDCDVYVLWSDEAYAELHCQDEWAEYSPSPIDLESFMEYWVPGMESDGYLVGVQFNADLAGLEVTPATLARDLSM